VIAGCFYLIPILYKLLIV